MIGPLVDKEISGNPELLNAIDFIESRQGFNVKLYPIQRLMVKCIFAVPVDYKMGKVPMYDVFREKLLRVVTEEECLHILYEEGRCNVGDWRDIPARGYNKASIIAGRRGGKSEVVAGIGGFKLYLLLNQKSPQEYFGLVPNSHIDFTFLAQDDSGSNRLYEKLREGVRPGTVLHPLPEGFERKLPELHHGGGPGKA